MERKLTFKKEMMSNIINICAGIYYTFHACNFTVLGQKTMKFSVLLISFIKNAFYSMLNRYIRTSFTRR